MNSSLKKMAFVAGLAGCCAALLLTSCSKKASEAIVGKWLVEKDGTIVEFHNDGTMSMVDHGQTMSGTYKFSDDSHMKAELTMPLPAEAKGKMPPGTPDSVSITADCTVAIKGDEMDIDASMTVAGQPAQSDKSHLKRVK